jgi:hypothetical protein
MSHIGPRDTSAELRVALAAARNSTKCAPAEECAGRLRQSALTPAWPDKCPKDAVCLKQLWGALVQDLHWNLQSRTKPNCNARATFPGAAAQREVAHGGNPIHGFVRAPPGQGRARTPEKCQMYDRITRAKARSDPGFVQCARTLSPIDYVRPCPALPPCAARGSRAIHRRSPRASRISCRSLSCTALGDGIKRKGTRFLAVPHADTAGAGHFDTSPFETLSLCLRNSSGTRSSRRRPESFRGRRPPFRSFTCACRDRPLCRA